MNHVRLSTQHPPGVLTGYVFGEPTLQSATPQLTAGLCVCVCVLNGRAWWTYWKSEAGRELMTAAIHRLWRLVTGDNCSLAPVLPLIGAHGLSILSLSVSLFLSEPFPFLLSAVRRCDSCLWMQLIKQQTASWKEIGRPYRIRLESKLPGSI